jgi:NAD(P)-dependent dehydrogenase (short-subunit alcohol dehydrogenase family)
MSLQRRLDAFKSTFESGGPPYNVFRERIEIMHQATEDLRRSASTALVTGGTSGIGRAAARKLAQLGIHVIVVGRNAERGEKTVAEIRAAGGKADVISADLHDASSAREVARRAIKLGNDHVDILINSAGIFPFGPTHEMTEEAFESVYALNVKVPYFLVATLAPLMAKRGKGAIVNVSTMAADYAVSGLSLYGSSKAAINLLTKAWAAEYGPSGVRVNAVSPGPTRTEGTDAMGEALDQLAAQAPAGRPATADEIAEPSCSWRRIVRVSFTAQNLPSTADAPRCEDQDGRIRAEWPGPPCARVYKGVQNPGGSSPRIASAAGRWHGLAEALDQRRGRGSPGPSRGRGLETLDSVLSGRVDVEQITAFAEQARARLSRGLRA